MPWTFSHPAAVLSFRRFCPLYLDFPAFVIGSVTPDVGYYIHRFDLASFAHSLAGSSIVCLSAGSFLLAVFYLMRRRVCYLLPMPHRGALLSLCSKPVAITSRRVLIMLLCLLLGAWSHILWDSFTHEPGWFAQRITWLRDPVFAIGSTPFAGYYLLQQISTVVGGIIVLVAYFAWLRCHIGTDEVKPSVEYWRYLLWALIILVALLIALPLGLRAARSLDGYPAFRVFVFRVAIYFVAAAIPMIILVSTIAYSVFGRSREMRSSRTMTTRASAPQKM